MQLVQTSDGPRVALSVAAVTILALETQKPIARQKAMAWLDAYRALVAAGVPDLQARLEAGEAWDAVPLPRKPSRRVFQRWDPYEDGPPWCKCLECGVYWQPPFPRRGKLRARVHDCWGPRVSAERAHV
jgi:hypothetical protein